MTGVIDDTAGKRQWLVSVVAILLEELLLTALDTLGSLIYVRNMVHFREYT